MNSPISKLKIIAENHISFHLLQRLFIDVTSFDNNYFYKGCGLVPEAGGDHVVGLHLVEHGEDGGAGTDLGG